MSTRESIALHLATRHAIAAGEREPWAWASANVDAFLDQADVPWTQKEVEDETAQLDAEDDARAALAALFVGPHPPADAPMDEQMAYVDAMLDALHPDAPRAGDPDASRQRWEALAARREQKGTGGVHSPG